jgi:hypothetical protein
MDTARQVLVLLKAVQYHCAECVGYGETEIPDCRGECCPLYPFRLGANPTGGHEGAYRLSVSAWSKRMRKERTGPNSMPGRVEKTAWWRGDRGFAAAEVTEPESKR